MSKKTYSQNEEPDEEQKKSKSKKKANRIKKVIGITMGFVGTAAAITGGLVYSDKRRRNKNYIIQNIERAKAVEKAAEFAKTAAKNSSVLKEIPEDLELSGAWKTASALGKQVLCSGREINKRIIEKGLAKRDPNGSISLTEIGKKLGKDTIKTNRYGHTFSNIEWDESILELIFDKEELKKIAEKMKLLGMK